MYEDFFPNTCHLRRGVNDSSQILPYGFGRRAAVMLTLMVERKPKK